jgi:glycosyltransferase involved in cell wall biosynthesis
MTKLISLVLPCYNEEGNVEEIYRRIGEVIAHQPQYRYEFIFIDNASEDRTQQVLRELAARDKRVKVILNSRNFGALRSQYHAILRARGDAVITMSTDLQDPPELIRDFIAKWEQGYKVVAGVLAGRKEAFLMVAIRNFYYRLIKRLSDTRLIASFTGFCLVDQKVVEVLRTIQDPNPYFRGLIAEIGFDTALVEYVQQKRHSGRTTTNFYYLFGLAMLGITNYSKVPLRLATMVGFLSATVSLLISLGYLIYKLLFWQEFTVGMAPIVIGMFFFSSLQLIFLGIVGEYIGSIHTNVLNRPLVIEKETINFDEPDAGGSVKDGGAGDPR